jgi:transposase
MTTFMPFWAKARCFATEARIGPRSRWRPFLAGREVADVELHGCLRAARAGHSTVFVEKVEHYFRRVADSAHYRAGAPGCSHKHAKVTAWLKRHPRFHIHFIPTSSSWLNLVERFFGEIPRRVIRPGSFRSVGALVADIFRLSGSSQPQS